MNNFSQVYAVGDIHGSKDLLDKIHKKVEIKSKNITGKKAIIYLGDYIDRGNKAKETIQALIDFQPKNFEKIFLLGNHEQMMIDFLNNKPNSLNIWITNGGRETLESYGVKPTSVLRGMIGNDKIIRDELNKKIDFNHKSFFKKLILNYSWKNYFFVHAGINPKIPLKDQDKKTILWTRSNNFFESKNIFEKIIVHGHTPKKNVENMPNRINLDTGAHYSGILSCVLIEENNLKPQFFDTSDN